MALEPELADLHRQIVALGLDERDLVRAARIERIAELHDIVLPEADGTDVVRAWSLVEHEVSATRAGILWSGQGHEISSYLSVGASPRYVRFRSPYVRRTLD